MQTARRKRVKDFLKTRPNQQATFVEIFYFLYPDGKPKQAAAFRRDLIQAMLADGDIKPVDGMYRVID